MRGIQFYQGDFKILPDDEKIEEMIRSWKDCPVAYTLDVGVADIPRNRGHNNTILVEVNDMWAIGSYGFDSKEYSLMCVRRMRQIINSNLVKK